MKPLKRCDKLWAEVVKKRAGYKSEYSGKAYDKENGVYLAAHHLIYKHNYRMRFEILNGFCLTIGEHKFIAHHPHREEAFKEVVKQVKGDDIFDRLNEMYRLSKTGGTDLGLVEIYLKQQLEAT